MNFRNFPEPLPEFKRRHAIITGFYSTMVHELSQANEKKTENTVNMFTFMFIICKVSA